MSTNQHVSASAETTGALTLTRPSSRVRDALLVVGGATAIALIGQISLPLPFTPVPVTLGTLSVLLVGGLLGAKRGAASAILFALAAAAGAPILAGWNSGITASFGYVVGYLFAAIIAGYAVRTPLLSAQAGGLQTMLKGLVLRFALMLLASAAVYVPGVIWLKIAADVTWQAAFAMGVLPFLLGDLLKSLLASFVPGGRL